MALVASLPTILFLLSFFISITLSNCSEFHLGVEASLNVKGNILTRTGNSAVGIPRTRVTITCQRDPLHAISQAHAQVYTDASGSFNAKLKGYLSFVSGDDRKIRLSVFCTGFSVIPGAGDHVASVEVTGVRVARGVTGGVEVDAQLYFLDEKVDTEFN